MDSLGVIVWRLSRSIRILGVLACLSAVGAPAQSPAVDPPAPRTEVPPAPVGAPGLRGSVEVVVARAMPRLFVAERRRLAWRGGWLGLGAYLPPGADAGWGYKVPPLDLFPRAGLGNSLNVSPITGRLR